MAILCYNSHTEKGDKEMSAKKLIYFIIGLLLFGILFYAINLEVNAYRIRLQHEGLSAETETDIEQNSDDFKVEN